MLAGQAKLDWGVKKVADLWAYEKQEVNNYIVRKRFGGCSSEEVLQMIEEKGSRFNERQAVYGLKKLEKVWFFDFY